MKVYFLLLVLPFIQSCSTLKMTEPPPPMVDLHLSRDWRCATDGADTICRPVSSLDELKKVIIWSAKEKGEDDSLESYRTHLSEVKKWKSKFRTITSVPVSNQVVNINGRDWVDAVQANSEVKDYTTRYLATVTETRAILVTLSARKELFKEFAKEIQPNIDGLVINP